MEKIKDWSEVTITNRFMFNKVFTSNIDACKELLEILLGFKITRIEKPQGEYQIEENIENRAVRFDIYTEDDNRMYDVEMQAEYETDLPERSRYYQSMMDVDSLQVGKPYKDLKDSIVIFICTFDPFGNKKPKYEFKNIDVIDNQTELGDRTKKVFFNVNEYDKIKNNEELKGLLKYFSKSDADTKFADKLTDLVQKAKKNERWRHEYMEYERWQYYERQHGIQEGVKQGFAQGISHQKAKDEKRFAQKDAEIAQQAERIRQLEAMLAKK